MKIFIFSPQCHEHPSSAGWHSFCCLSLSNAIVGDTPLGQQPSYGHFPLYCHRWRYPSPLLLRFKQQFLNYFIGFTESNLEFAEIMDDVTSEIASGKDLSLIFGYYLTKFDIFSITKDLYFYPFSLYSVNLCSRWCFCPSCHHHW